ncbi:hypothetical protein OS493_009305 [Desmophyllum pertusum]|uniref:Uncharacterized protein n=1 Tax=Desmophyllum pertusum TaxID=174260 RepID=A0A9X0CS30_9CNID|nr:hypothetical protein OS493_009305 [Desmophyllum pertusum]
MALTFLLVVMLPPGLQTSSDDPMPINMELKALSELLTEEFLGDSGIDYEKLKQPLIDYLTQYCSKLVDEDKAKGLYATHRCSQRSKGKCSAVVW